MNNKTLVMAAGALVVVLAIAFLWQSATNGGMASLLGNHPTVATSTTDTQTTTGKVSTTIRASSDVASIASHIVGASTFASLFASTGVKATITGKGPYTIFVPTDGSISLLAPGTIQNLSAAEKKRLVQYHIIKGRAVDPAGIETGFMTALSGDVLNFDVSDIDETARINNSFVVKAYKGSNGVVYLISAVLFPPAPHQTNQ